MNQKMKGALLSGLVFPGLGQIFLGRKLLGVALIGLTAAGIAGIVAGLMQRLPLIIDLLQKELQQGTLDSARILAISNQAAASGTTALENIGMILLVSCWAASIVHALVAGTRRTGDHSGPGSPPLP
ncbi:MAG: hypothetical protein L3J03_08020 [Desulfobacterales bacterium]|nr:hypothetical protein [Desulfobacterales bacterium]